MIKCDAGGMGIGVILMQENQHIVYLSKALKGRALDHLTYKNEFSAFVTLVKKWRPYLLG